jgi:hypothetical protein
MNEATLRSPIETGSLPSLGTETSMDSRLCGHKAANL